MPDWIKLGFVMVLFVLVIALLVPSLIGVGETDATDTLSMDNQTDTALTERLSVSVTDIDTDATPPAVTVEYTDETTLGTTETVVDVGNTSTVVLSGNNLTTGVEAVDGQTARINATYPPMFGWDDGPRAFWEESGLIIALLAALVIIGILLAVGRSI